MDPATALGPLVSAAQRDLLAEQVSASMDAGAEALVGGVAPERTGYYYPATVLTDVPDDSPAGCEELFGPVAVVHVAEDLADAMRVANDTPWGLGAIDLGQDDATRSTRPSPGSTWAWSSPTPSSPR